MGTYKDHEPVRQTRDADEIEPLRDEQWPQKGRLTAEQCYQYVTEAQSTGWRKGAGYGDTEEFERAAPFRRREVELDAIDNPTPSNPAAVERYKEQGPPFPPVVFGPNGFLIDGYHRLAAAKDCAESTITAYIPVIKTV